MFFCLKVSLSLPQPVWPVNSIFPLRAGMTLIHSMGFPGSLIEGFQNHLNPLLNTVSETSICGASICSVPLITALWGTGEITEGPEVPTALALT